MDIQRTLQGLVERVSASASVKNVYGDPVVVGNRTLVPAAHVRYAFGSGGGNKEGREGGGVGGRVFARPCGALEITPENARFIPFDDRRRIGTALILGFVLGAALATLTDRGIGESRL